MVHFARYFCHFPRRRAAGRRARFKTCRRGRAMQEIVHGNSPFHSGRCPRQAPVLFRPPAPKFCPPERQSCCARRLLRRRTCRRYCRRARSSGSPAHARGRAAPNPLCALLAMPRKPKTSPRCATPCGEIVRETAGRSRSPYPQRHMMSILHWFGCPPSAAAVPASRIQTDVFCDTFPSKCRGCPAAPLCYSTGCRSAPQSSPS